MTNASEFGLGRLEYKDPRSQNYQIYPLLRQMDLSEPRSKTYNLGAQLNQGSSGRCVGYTGAAELGASPVRWAATNDLGNVLYELSCARDVWRENDNGDINFGTNDVALLIAMRQLGFITEFRWCGAGSGRALEDFVLALGYKGPVLFGSDWLASMDIVQADGRIVVDQSTQVRGGHEYLFYRIVIRWLPGAPPPGYRRLEHVDLDASRAYVRNSWGGVGNGFMTLRDVDTLQKRGATAVIPLRRGVTS